MEAFWKRQVPRLCGCIRVRGDLEQFYRKIRKSVIEMSVADSPSSGMGDGGGWWLNIARLHKIPQGSTRHRKVGFLVVSTDGNI